MNNIQQFANEYPAFINWARLNYEGDPVGLAQYILESIAAGEPDCIFFELLELTGDKSFDGDTLIKAADLVLTTTPEKRGVSNE